MVLEKLNNLELHDQELLGLNIDFDTKEIRMFTEIFNIKKNDFDSITLIFKAVEDLKFESFIDCIAINFYSTDFDVINNKFKADFGFVLEGCDLSSWKMNFLFKESQVLEGHVSNVSSYTSGVIQTSGKIKL